MKAIQIRPHQMKAIDAIKTAIDKKQSKISIEMEIGTGETLVLAKALEYLISITDKKILIVTGFANIRDSLSNILFSEYKDLVKIEQSLIDIKTVQYISKHQEEIDKSYEYIVVYDVPNTSKCYDLLYKSEKSVIVFRKYIPKLFQTDDTVFTYSYQDAIKDGILTPAINPSMYEYAAKGFCKRLLGKYNCELIDDEPSIKDRFWDFHFCNEDKNLWVYYKNYKSEWISPSAINMLLKNIVWTRVKQKLSDNDIILLILFGNVSGLDRKVLYSKHKIIIWDISNLIFYTENDKSLLKELSQLTYFPIENIVGAAAEGWNITTISSSDEIEKISTTAIEYINDLKSFEAGRKKCGEYEELCERIIQYLFGEAFHIMSPQHKTGDKHFRMDLICSFKGMNENTHSFWQLLAQHYNTRFVVFEFKNYSEPIDQNLIYITEKYLFNPALRNVAIIISHKGFSSTAKFAAEGCLKENGKLILDITNDDLIKMLEAKQSDGEPTDILMEIFEEFLMSLSK